MEWKRPKIIPPGKRGDDQIPAATEEELRNLDRAERPKVRADCEDDHRPCPWVSCKWHLALDVNPVTGVLRLTFPGMPVEDMDETCSLDVAERDGATLDQVGRLSNITRERVRQIEVYGLVQLRLLRPGDEPLPGESGHSGYCGVLFND